VIGRARVKPLSEDEIRRRQLSDPAVQQKVEEARRRVKEGRTKPGKTADELLNHRYDR